ncbi:MAG: tetratricopeptide repeat protein [Candidatus Eisenbacteria bacterium]|uniref:Tetratricopeptide repeat protein n=1 Tax=Eiseniibacteriota bacterium TaxID=2212470 RepID=A0A938BQB4_UNCEI|nr:tetratricopeptide repeat protein [Candidatus Eisenbacteria bacterium]
MIGSLAAANTPAVNNYGPDEDSRMGLFGKRSNPIEKIEARGDAALARGEPLEARRQFRDALRRLDPQDPAVARLRERADSAQSAFREQKLAEARTYLEDGAAEAALEALAILREDIDGQADRLVERIGPLEARAREILDGPSRAVPGVETIEAMASPAGGAPLEEDEGPATETIDAAADAQELFEQFSGALPPEDRERAATLGPSFRLGFVRAQLGDPSEALAAFEQAAREHPGEPLVLEHLAVVMDQLGRGADAERLYRRALEGDPKRTNARLALASILDGGMASEQERSAGDPDSGDGEAPRSGQTASGPDCDAALKLLSEGAALDPEHAVVHFLAGADIALRAGRPAEGLAWAERGLRAGGEAMPDAWMTYATALEAAGSVDEAEKAHLSAVRLGGHAILPRARFAEFALRTGQALPRAQEVIFETCLTCQASAPAPETLAYYGFLLTRIQFARGMHKDAYEGARRLLDQDPPREMAAELRRLTQAAREAMEEQSQSRRKEEGGGALPGAGSGLPSSD